MPKPAITHAQARSALEAGMSLTDTARLHECSRNAVYRALRRELMTGPLAKRRSSVHRLRLDIQEMGTLEAVEHLLFVIEELVSAEHQLECFWPDVHLRPAERVILSALYAREGRVTTHQTLRAELALGRDMPTANTVKVHIMRIRRQTRGRGFTIRNIHGLGYVFDRDEGAIFPWEKSE